VRFASDRATSRSDFETIGPNFGRARAEFHIALAELVTISRSVYLKHRNGQTKHLTLDAADAELDVFCGEIRAARAEVRWERRVVRVAEQKIRPICPELGTRRTDFESPRMEIGNGGRAFRSKEVAVHLKHVERC
jgi:hypothetical protein